MKKTILLLMIICLSLVVMGCYYGKSENWESTYNNAESKNKGNGNFFLSYKKDNDVLFDNLEIKLEGKTIFKKENFKKSEFSVPNTCTKCIANKEKLDLDINWKVNGKEYKETLTLDKQ